MVWTRVVLGLAFGIWAGGSLLAGSSSADAPPEPSLPPPAREKVDFASQVEPILRESCLSCHAKGKYKGGLSLETREALLKGGEEGPAAVVGKSEESLMVLLAAGHEEGRLMP